MFVGDDPKIGELHSMNHERRPSLRSEIVFDVARRERLN
jgi:hypothetical protein